MSTFKHPTDRASNDYNFDSDQVKVLKKYFDEQLHYSRLIVTDDQMAWEITTETIHAFQNLNQHDNDEEAIEHFLFKTTGMNCIKYWMALKLSADWLRKGLIGTRKEQDIKKQEIILKAIFFISKIHAVIDELPAGEKEVAKLYFDLKIPPAQISDRLRLPISKIESLKNNAAEHFTQRFLLHP
jgi:DNA-directed RNA polymerase specialized sigma24 family protein